MRTSALFERRLLFAAIIFVFRSTVRSYPLRLTTTVLLIAGTAIAPYAVSGFQALLINTLTAGTGGVLTQTLLLLLAGMALLFLLQEWSQYLYSYADKLLWYKTAAKHESELSAKLLELDIATHESQAFQNDLQVLQENGSAYVVSNFLSQMLSSGSYLISLFAAAAIVLSIEWKLLLLIALFTAPRFIIEVKYGRGIWGVIRAHSTSRRHFFEIRKRTQDTSSVAEIQTMQAESFFINRARTLLKQYYDAKGGQEWSRLWLLLIAQVLATGAVAVALIVLVLRALAGDLQIGTLVFGLGAVIGFQSAITSLFLDIAQLQDRARPVVTFRNIMMLDRFVRNPIAGKRLATSSAPSIEFKNVSFAYPSRPDIFVLKDFSLIVNPGERLALIGINGAGKSTLIKLLCRFYDPTEGQVLVNGIDLREIELSSWYGMLALLTQDFTTYKFKANELIALGQLNSSDDQEQVRSAATHAEANEFIENWEDKYEQQLGVQFGGIDPSGGQKQKLALARTLFRNALVTVLDEPTAHVDANAEQQIFERLYSELRKDQTLIVISHRFSTIRSADRICIVEDGRVRELGSHDELIALNGTYAKLFNVQARQYK